MNRLLYSQDSAMTWPWRKPSLLVWIFAKSLYPNFDKGRKEKEKKVTDSLPRHFPEEIAEAKANLNKWQNL